MRKLLTRVLTTIGALVVLLVALGLIARFAVRSHVPAHTVVELDLERPLAEYTPPDTLGRVLHGPTPTVRDLLDGLERAAADERVTGLVARVGEVPAGLGQLQEIRDAITAFRATGKRTVAFSEALGEFGPGNGAYYLATAFAEVYLQPSGDVGLTGLIAEAPFVRGTLDKLGIVPRLDHRKEYKTAMNMFTERGYTEPHREATGRVLTSQFGQIVRGIAEARGLTEPAVRAIVDRGPLSAEAALQEKLVDGLLYRDEVYAKFEKDKRMPLGRYLARAGTPHEEGAVIALIYGVGGVQRGKSAVDPVSGEVTMGADTVSAALRAAAEDESVRAILFRVDSPGGSYVASDTIWREVGRARAAGKPVIVSMGNVAGSGGYFVAVGADKIVAQPGTITGSIGVLGGKMLTSGLWEKLGVNWDELHTSTNGAMWTGTRDYTPAEWAKFETALDRIYADFTGKVAAGRGLPLEKVQEVAKGRIWTGEDAKERGLVDELGGFPTALRLAREAAALAPDAPVQLEVFPPSRTLLETLLGRLLEEETGPRDGDEEEASVVAVRGAVAASAAVTRLLREVGLVAPEVLRMPALPMLH